MSRTIAALLAAYGLLLFGCGSNPLGRHAISGKVVVDGAPLAKGNVSFQPTEGQATDGGAVIENGRYEVAQAGGLLPGKYKVAINAAVPGTGGGTDENSLPGDPPAPPKELIPPQWNSASTQIIEVKKQGKNVFDFEIATKGGKGK